MDFMEVVKKRRSIRHFKPDPVPDELIEQILEAARLAPSGVNIQPWRFMVVKNPERRAKLVEAAHRQQFVGEAPVVIVCCANLKSYLNIKRNVNELVELGAVTKGFAKRYIEDVNLMTMDLSTHIPSATINTTVAIEHMVLTATALGLGCCWVNYINPTRVAEICGIYDEDIFVMTLLPIGYPAEDPPPRPRLPLEEILLPEPEFSGNSGWGR